MKPYTLIPIAKQRTAAENAQDDALMNCLHDDWRRVESAVLDVFSVLLKHGLWGNEDACNALLRITTIVLPDRVNQSWKKILSDFWEDPSEESAPASTR